MAIQTQRPDEKNDYHVIDHVTFNQKKDNLNYETTLYFNPNLNTIIGGRSNGKSVLSNSIAKALGNDHFEKEKGMYTYPDGNLQVFWCGDENYNNERQIEFLPQDYMITIAENDSLRNKLLKRIIQEDQDNYQKVKDYEENRLTITDKITALLNDRKKTKNELYNLTPPEGDKSGVEKQIAQIEEQLKKEQEKTADITPEDSATYQKIQSKLIKSNKALEQCQTNISLINDLKNLPINISVQLPHIDSKSLNNSISALLSNLSDYVSTQWQENLVSISKEQIKEKNEIKAVIIELQKDSTYKKVENSLAGHELLQKLNIRRNEERKKREAFDEYESTKLELENKVCEYEKAILEEYKNFNSLRENLKSKFSISSNDKVEITVDFVPVPFEDKILYLYKKSNKNNEFIADFDQNSDKKIQQIFDELSLKYNQNKSQEDLIHDIFTTNWFTLNYVLRYENDLFTQMSQGKKAFVILSLILEFSQDKKPVIIDQPEDSLDNRAIYHELTQYLKDKKKSRQIILITHNPNIVVGADSENVIVANQHSDRTPNENKIQFAYINGSLENSSPNNGKAVVLNKNGIREHVIEILEGGDDAFKKREQKYDL